MIKKNVLLVGCGGIGFRHLQALTLLNNRIEIDILEKKKLNQIIRDLITANNRIKINYFNHIKKIKQNYDIIIFATTSRFTFNVFLETLKYSSTKNILFEKITFSEIKQYSLAKKLLIKHKINAWVNCSNRYQNWVKYVKKNLKLVNKFNLVCEGQNDNLISNFVHYFDLFNYLSNEKRGKLISLNLYRLYKSKRKTYFDSEGEGIVTNKKKNTLTYNNKITKGKKFQINYSFFQKKKKIYKHKIK